MHTSAWHRARAHASALPLALLSRDERTPEAHPTARADRRPAPAWPPLALQIPVTRALAALLQAQAAPWRALAAYLQAQAALWRALGGSLRLQKRRARPLRRSLQTQVVFRRRNGAACTC